MSSIQEKAKTFGRNIEKWAKKTIKNGKPLGTTSLHHKPTPQEDLPRIRITINDPIIRTVEHRRHADKPRIGFVPRSVPNRGMHARDAVTVLRFLIRNYGVSPNAFEKAMQQENLWRKTQSEIKKQHDLEGLQRAEERKKNFSELKSLWTYNHMPDYVDKVTEMIRSLSQERKIELKRQIKNGQFPSRWSSAHRTSILTLIEALEKKN